MNKQNIKTTTLKQYEIKEVAKLYKISLRDNQQGFIQILDFEKGIKDMVSDFRANRGEVYLLKKDNQIIGMGALKRVNITTIEMCKLHVYPHLKGFGLGKRLALDLMEYAKSLGYSKINLHVTKTQKEAIGLYTRLGFTEYQQKLCQVEKNGHILEFDTLYMERELESEALEFA